MENLNTWLVVLILIVGLVLIVKGGDFFVDGASWMAEISGIPKLIVGATVVSLATTLPELLVSALAAAKGNVDMAAGNAVGSVIANIGLILGISLIFMPSTIKRSNYYFKTAFMLVPCIIIFAFAFNGNSASTLSLVACILMVIIFALNAVENVWSAKKQMRLNKEASSLNSMSDEPEKEKRKITKKEIIINVIKFIVGAGGIVGGAQLLVSSSTVIASRAGISEQVIGLTIVAVGTSLPELVTTITAIVKKEHSLSVGNIIGANIIDMTLILPVCAFIKGGSLPVSAQTVLLDVPVFFLLGAVAMFPALIIGKFRRWQGVALLVLYAAYITCLFVGVGF